MTLQDLEQAVSQLTRDEQLRLFEHLSQAIHLETPSAPDKKRMALHELRMELATLPVVNPADGFSNRDHDRLIYGGER